MGRKSKLPLSKARKSRKLIAKRIRKNVSQLPLQRVNTSNSAEEILQMRTHSVDDSSTTFQSDLPKFESLCETTSTDDGEYVDSLRIQKKKVFIDDSDILEESSDGNYDESIYVIEKKQPVDSNKGVRDEMGGRRIVDVQYLFEQVAAFPHCELFSCRSDSIEFAKETRKGFLSEFLLKCRMCLKEHIIKSDRNEGKLNTNAAAVSGIISVGCGFSQLNEFAASLNVPPISFKLYKNLEEELYDAYNVNLWELMLEAGKEEAKLAVEAGDVDANDIPMITVVADGAWSKRSYRNNYNANSGVACIIGLRTGKILFLSVRNKYCSICNTGKNKQHTCYKNWNASSTSMETDIILEGFKESMSMHNVKYGYLVGDGDSSVYTKLLSEKPYGSSLVQKIECSNHLLRNYVTKLTNLISRKFSSNGTAVSSTLRNILKTNIKRLRYSVDCALRHRRSEVQNTFEQQVSLLKNDIKNSIDHVFGSHKNCDPYFCNKQNSLHEHDYTEEMRECWLYNDIISCASRLLYHSSSLIKNMTNNCAENYNSVLVKFVGGKRVDYAKGFGYEMRCVAAAISVNTAGEFHSSVHQSLTHRSPGYHVKKFIRRKKNQLQSKRKLFNMATPNRKGNKKYKKNAEPDEDYGPDVQLMELDHEEIQHRKTIFLNNLKKTKEEVHQIALRTIDQAQSVLWMEEREKRLTASNFGRICKMVRANPQTVAKNILKSFAGNDKTKYGKDMEPIACDAFKELMGIRIEGSGFYIDLNSPYLGASPDGLIESDGLVEIKCPHNARNLTPTEAIALKKVNFGNIKDNKFQLKREHNYHYQVQGQLHITGRKYCYFVFWTPKGILYEKIDRDENWFQNKMYEKLKNFYYNYLLPEIMKNHCLK